MKAFISNFHLKTQRFDSFFLTLHLDKCKYHAKAATDIYVKLCHAISKDNYTHLR